MAATTKILLIFKTHLDLGFTDLAEEIHRKYMTEYIPHALALAKETRNRPYRFRWTVGSWLLEQYRTFTHDSSDLVDAVAHGDIRWHAMPFTTHTEYMDAGLLDYGLSLSQRLDARYGLHTTAAKLTDVPGHTLAMVPHLAAAGVRFLHIGVNPASTVPAVPPLFWWQAPSGERVLVMYNSDYGQMTPIGNSSVSVYFAHTGDNRGPQSAEEIQKLYESLHVQYPDAVLEAGTLEDVAQIALEQEDLPVITSEIGDSWIHGTGTDPAKTSAYRALLRTAKDLPQPQRDLLYENLLPVPEHTWGLDEKTHLTGTYQQDFQLGEHRFFVRQEFEAVRQTQPFRLMEASWQEQRDYVIHAAQAANIPLPPAVRTPTDPAGWTRLHAGQQLHLGGFTAALDEHGISSLVHRGRVWADEAHRLVSFCYEVFSQAEYDRFRREYVTSDEPWAVEDFGKIGVDAANDRYRAYDASFTEAYGREDALLLRTSLPEQACTRFGAPEQVELLLQFGADEIFVDCAWFQKKASRVPEALWLSFNPKASLHHIHKLDAWLDPYQVVLGGNRRMHVTQKGVVWDGLRVEGLDTGLVSLGGPSLLQFDGTLPPTDASCWFCLYNNVWGTNFPMWYEKDARFRFILTFAGGAAMIDQKPES